MNQEQYHGMMILVEKSDDGIVQELDPLGIPDDILSGLRSDGFIDLSAVDGCSITTKGYDAIAEYRAAAQHSIEEKYKKRKQIIRSFWKAILIAGIGAALALLVEHFGDIVS